MNDIDILYLYYTFIECIFFMCVYIQYINTVCSSSDTLLVVSIALDGTH